MLILTRRVGESLSISDTDDNLNETRIVVLGVKGNQVRIGVNAPPSKRVMRDELIQDELLAQGKERYTRTQLEKAANGNV